MSRENPILSRPNVYAALFAFVSACQNEEIVRHGAASMIERMGEQAYNTLLAKVLVNADEAGLQLRDAIEEEAERDHQEPEQHGRPVNVAGSRFDN